MIEPGGGTAPNGGPLPGTLRQSAGALTVTGSGDIGPIAGNTGGGLSLQRALIGTFFGLIPLMVVGAMFITAEYRRGLIRVSLTAAPRRGRLLAAKAVVIGAVGFVAGLVAATLALAVGTPALRRTGIPLWPVSALTEARMVVGIAALLAVAAVLFGPRLGLPRCVHDGFDHDCAGAVIEAGKGVVEADRNPPAMLAASRRTRCSPPPHGNWPASRAVIVASQSMLAITVPALTLVPVMMNRLEKSSQCSQQPQPIRRFEPASSGRIPLAKARRAAGSRRARSMAVTRFSRPRPLINSSRIG